MKLRNLFLALIAGSAALVACEEIEELADAKITLDQVELNIPKEGGSATVSLVATRDWMISGDLPDWLALSANSGQASVNPQTITVSADENKGNDREVTVSFTIGTKRASVLVKQEGEKGEVKKGTGTKEDPYTVAGVIAYLETLGADVNSPNSVYIKGKVSAVDVDKSNVEQYYSNTGTYGNATFFISDDGTTTTQFECYRILYLGNKKFATGDTDIKLGDDVVIFGKVVNYKGNTPETVQGSAFLFSLNGVDRGGDEVQTVNTAEAKGTGTEADPFNVAAAIAKAQAVGQTASSEAYYIKGKVKTVTEQFSASFGNGTFVLIDDGFEDAVFTAYRILYFGNQKWADGDKTINVGDEIVVIGKIINFRGNTPETDQGSAYLYSINGEVGTGNTNPPAEVTQAEPAGDGSQANPFNVSAAINKAKEVGKTATTEDLYVKGKVSKITEQFSASFGNGTFELIDDGFTAVFTAYRILYFGGEKWAEGDATVAVGDEIVAVGKIINYNDKTPEITQGGHLYSLNGQTSVAQSPVFDVEKTEISVAASATTAQIKVKGNVAWTVSRQPGDVTVDPTSGEGAGTITVTFAANESTEHGVDYTIALSTEAEVANKTILVTIKQSKAAAPGETATITIPLTNTTTFAEDNGGDTLKSGFAATVEGFKVATYKYKSTTNPVTPDQYAMKVYKSAVFYIAAPSGKTITALCFKASDYDNKKYILDMTGVEGTDGTATADKDSDMIKWEGEASTVILQAAAGQTRLENVEVYYK